jgi:hypothetical protein
MRELSVAEQRYKAVLAVISEGKTVTEVAAEWRVSRQTLHSWLIRYEGGGLEALGNRSHRPAQCLGCIARRRWWYSPADPAQPGRLRDRDWWDFVNRYFADSSILLSPHEHGYLAVVPERSRRFLSMGSLSGISWRRSFGVRRVLSRQEECRRAAHRNGERNELFVWRDLTEVLTVVFMGPAQVSSQP